VEVVEDNRVDSSPDEVDLLKKLLRKLKYIYWVLNGYLGWPIHSRHDRKTAVLLTYFNPVRMDNIDSQIRNILKCTFVEEIVISNHNPDVRIEEKVKIRDNRVKFLDQDIRRACGYRWRIAGQLASEYLLVIDDDILLFPPQLKTLFEALIKEPSVPHGFSGMVMAEDGGYEYFEQEDMRVHYLCEVYGVTKEHINKYFEMEQRLAEQDQSLPDVVERLGDYILISCTAEEYPLIHDAGRIFRSVTYKSQGVANHKDKEFLHVLSDVTRALRKLKKVV
jgi:glycosyltransferase involved in cell wall biosynthesis